MRILVIEDERKIASFIKRGLEEEGYTVDTVYDGREGFARASSGDYDLLLLDLMLPGLDGRTLSRQLREQGVTTPVLMLTAKDTLKNKVEGLDSGADDYMTKPFAFEELVARVRALLRRHHLMSPTMITVGDVALDPVARVVTRGDRRIDLTNREFQLLDLLMRNVGRVVSRTVILNRIWGYDFDGGGNIVDAYVARLRKKLDVGHAARLIQTIRDVGYTVKE